MGCAFEIADAGGMVLLDVPFTETVRAAPAPRHPPFVALRPVDQVERAYELAASVRAHVERIQESIEAARDLLKDRLPPIGRGRK